MEQEEPRPGARGKRPAVDRYLIVLLDINCRVGQRGAVHGDSALSD
jgi:hypothetical protein